MTEKRRRTGWESWKGKRMKNETTKVLGNEEVGWESYSREVKK